MINKRLISIGALLTLSTISLSACSFYGGNRKSDTLKSNEEVRELIGDNYALKAEFIAESDDSDRVTIETKQDGEFAFTLNYHIDDSEVSQEKRLSKGNLVYQYDDVSHKYTSITRVRGAELSTLDALSFILGYDTGLTSTKITYNTKETGTFIGRPVTIYTTKIGVSLTGIISAGYTNTYTFDDATGLCLKMIHSINASTAGDSSGGSFGYEVKSFTIGGVSLDSEIAKVVVSEWPTETQFDEMGIPALQKVNGSLVNAEVNLVDGLAYSYSLILEMEDETSFTTLTEEAYSLGFDKNSNLENRTLEELIESDVFQGYYDENSSLTAFKAGSLLTIYFNR